MKLNQISDNQGATKNRKRIGRGIGSGTGKTGGRGVKGQKSRSGVSLVGFEGGQMPLYRRLPKRGFTNPFTKVYDQVNVGLLQKFVDSGKLDASQPVTESALIAAGVARKKPNGVKLLGKGALTVALNLEVAAATKGAIAAVEKAGGSVTVTAAAPAAAE